MALIAPVRPAFGRRPASPATGGLLGAPEIGTLLAPLGRALVDVDAAERLLQPQVAARFDPASQPASRGALAAALAAFVDDRLAAAGLWLAPGPRRALVSRFLGLLIEAGGTAPPVTDVLPQIAAAVIDRIDAAAAAKMGRGELARRLTGLVGELLAERRLHLNGAEVDGLVNSLLDDMLGLGPLQALLADDGIADIMVNGPEAVFIERHGRLERAPVRFRDADHVMAVASRIVAQVGRRVDESSPLVDARLVDGSRVNIIIPPLALDGVTISIRKFARRRLDLAAMAAGGSLSPAMAEVLAVAAAVRLNILVSGGTGSGKTTLLNALAREIAPDERIVTIEDAAELQLGQPHVVRLETRPANLEGTGAIGMRELVKNALRMRPDRIILGEIRGDEALDMLQAMNTGHDGSLGTIHANAPREALTRLENMIGMAGVSVPLAALRLQIASAVHLIVQVERMRDGVRRVTRISEVGAAGPEGIALHDLFAFDVTGGSRDGAVAGQFVALGTPGFAARAGYFGLAERLAAVT